MTHTKNKCDKLSLFLDHKKLGGRFSVSHVINHKKYDITLSQRQLAVIRKIRDFQLLVSRNKKVFLSLIFFVAADNNPDVLIK